jgi:hypothetical protein
MFISFGQGVACALSSGARRDETGADVVRESACACARRTGTAAGAGVLVVAAEWGRKDGETRGRIAAYWLSSQ